VYRAGPSWRLLDVLDERRLSVVAGARARVAEVAWAQRAEATGAAFARSMLVVAGAALGVSRRRPVIRPRRIAEAEGWDAVTIRRLATELGVTQPVLYTAFGKRQDIVDAVALRGFAELAAALDAGDPAAAYLDFARAHPATHEAMFLIPTGLRFAATDVPAPMRVAFTALGRARGIADDVRTEIAWPPSPASSSATTSVCSRTGARVLAA
jgi:hypothetical protein